ncbi:ECF transporter S component [Virgibacillus proomii]|uniref:ECF transporter S component n=1 Tax=Virgibacillus proomii TaxID=84407 RepID=UPI001C0FE630|nr:ECF transporter S component [Virgibacillus proomii]MBU5265381.1 ECF transporter S component [Virgibacillus proomii]
MNTYKLTLLAILAAIAIVGRYWFSFIPNVQPVTSIIIIAGLLLGPVSAVILTFIITFVSNILLGMGIWMVWQIISWGIIGILSGWMGKVFHHISLPFLLLFAIFSGYFYGFIISLITYQITGAFWPYYISGLPFDTNHAIGNAVFMVLFYPAIPFLIQKYASNRFSVKNTD